MQCEYRLKHRNGRYLWVSVNATAIRDLRGRLLKIVGIISDINEQKVIESYDGNLRVTFINAEGYAVVDNLVEVTDMENHNKRPEVVEARRNGYGSDIRKSETLQKKGSMRKLMMSWYFLPVQLPICPASIRGLGGSEGLYCSQCERYCKLGPICKS